MVPIEGLPVLGATMLGAMASGVLVRLLIADSALPCEGLDISLFPAG